MHKLCYSCTTASVRMLVPNYQAGYIYIASLVILVTRGLILYRDVSVLNGNLGNKTSCIQGTCDKLTTYINIFHTLCSQQFVFLFFLHHFTTCTTATNTARHQPCMKYFFFFEAYLHPRWKENDDIGVQLVTASQVQSILSVGGIPFHPAHNRLFCEYNFGV